MMRSAWCFKWWRLRDGLCYCRDGRRWSLVFHLHWRKRSWREGRCADTLRRNSQGAAGVSQYVARVLNTDVSGGLPEKVVNFAYYL